MSNVNMSQEIEVEEAFNNEAEQFYANAAMWQEGDNFPMRDEYDDDEMMNDERDMYDSIEHEFAGYDGEQQANAYASNADSSALLALYQSRVIRQPLIAIDGIPLGNEWDSDMVKGMSIYSARDR